MDTAYEVYIDLKTRGSLSDIGNQVSKLGSASGMLTGLSSALDGVSHRALKVVKHLGLLAAGGAVAALTYGVIGLSQHLESAQISIAAIFGAQGFTSNMNDGMTLAADTMSKMRKDAAALPGEFSDLLGIFKTIATPGAAAGMNADALRAFSAKSMAVGAVMGLQSDQTAREMAMLLEGRAGAHNVLGMRLGFIGDKAHALKEAPEAKRAEMVGKELDKYAPAIEKFSHSFEGLSTSFLDNGKRFLGLALAPVFEHVKALLERTNAWFDKNEGKINAFASMLGDKLASAFDAGVAMVARWWPAIESFAENAYTKIVSIWEAIAPAVERAGAAMRGFLGDPAAMDRIKSTLELFLAARLAGPAMKLGAAVAKGVGGLGEAGSGLGGGLGAVGEAGGVAAIGVMAVVGAFHTVKDASSDMHNVAVENWKQLKTTTVYAMTAMQQAGEALKPALAELSDVLGVALLGAANAAAAVFAGLAWTIKNITKPPWMKDVPTAGLAPEERGDFDGKAVAKHIRKMGNNDDLLELTKDLAKAHQDKLDNIAQNTNPQKNKHPGGGGVHVDKVEIAVTSNQDPSRIARMVKSELANLRLHPTASRRVLNASGAL